MSDEGACSQQREPHNKSATLDYKERRPMNRYLSPVHCKSNSAEEIMSERLSVSFVGEIV